MTSPITDLDVLRESQDRALHREGIPMLVVLSDERPGAGTPAHAEQPADAARLADRIEQYRQSLAPDQRDTDMGVLISILGAAAYEDFDRSVTA